MKDHQRIRVRQRIAANVSAELRRRRISTTMLPTLAGGSQSAWQRRTSGTSPITAEELLELSAVLKVPVERFFVDVEVTEVTDEYGSIPANHVIEFRSADMAAPEAISNHQLAA